MANGSNVDTINLTLIKQYKIDFESEKSNFQHSSFATFTNGYINHCDDPYIKIMAQKLNAKYTEIDNSYFKILEWWNNFVSTYENAESLKIEVEGVDSGNILSTVASGGMSAPTLNFNIPTEVDDKIDLNNNAAVNFIGAALKEVNSIETELRKNPKVQAAEAVKKENQKFYNMIAKENGQLASIIQMQADALKEEGVEITYEETYYMLLQSVIENKINAEATTEEEKQKLLEEITGAIENQGDGYAYNLIVSYFDNVETDYIKEKTDYYKKHPFKKFFCGDEMGNEGFCAYLNRYAKDEFYVMAGTTSRNTGTLLSFVFGTGAKIFDKLGIESAKEACIDYMEANDKIFMNNSITQKADLAKQDLMDTIFLAVPENDVTKAAVSGYYNFVGNAPTLIASTAATELVGGLAGAAAGGSTAAEGAAASASAKIAYGTTMGAFKQAGGDMHENVMYNLEHGLDALKGTDATYFGGLAYGGFTGYFGNKIGVSSGSLAGGAVNVLIDAGQGGLDVIYDSAIKSTYNGQSFKENFNNAGGFYAILEGGFTAALTSIATDKANKLKESFDAKKYKSQTNIVDADLDINNRMVAESENSDSVHLKDRLSDYMNKFTSGLGKLTTNNAGYVNMGALADLFGFKKMNSNIDIKNTLEKMYDDVNSLAKFLSTNGGYTDNEILDLFSTKSKDEVINIANDIAKNNSYIFENPLPKDEWCKENFAMLNSHYSDKNVINQLFECIKSDDNCAYGVHATPLKESANSIYKDGLRLTGHASSGVNPDGIHLSENINFFKDSSVEGIGAFNKMCLIEGACGYGTANGVGYAMIIKIPKDILASKNFNKIIYTYKGDNYLKPEYVVGKIEVIDDSIFPSDNTKFKTNDASIYSKINSGNVDSLEYYKKQISNTEAYLDQCIKYSLEKSGDYTPENFLELKNKLMSGKYGSNYINTEVRKSFEQYYNYRKECIDYVNSLKNSKVNDMFGVEKANQIRERLEAVGYTDEQINNIFNTNSKGEIKQIYKSAQNMFTTDEVNQISRRLNEVGYTAEQINNIFNTNSKKQIKQIYKNAQNMFTTDEVNQISRRLNEVGYTAEQINNIFNTNSKKQIEQIYKNAQNMLTIDETNTIVNTLRQAGYVDEQINNIFKMGTDKILEYYNYSVDYINNNSNPLQKFMNQNTLGNNNSIYRNNRYYGVEKINIEHLRDVLLKYNNQCKIEFWGGRDKSNFMNFTIGTEPQTPLLNSYKIYLPVEGVKSVNNLDIILNYMIKNNIASNNKIFRTTGTDAICLRIYDAKSAAKIIDFINNNPAIDVTAAPPPFARQYGKVALSMDGLTSYNSRAISAYSNYINQTQQPTISGFLDYIRGAKNQIDSGHAEAFDIFNDSSYDARGSIDNMVNTYQIIETILLGLDSNVSIQEYFSVLQKHQTLDNYDDLFYRMLDLVRVK